MTKTDIDIDFEDKQDSEDDQFFLCVLPARLDLTPEEQAEVDVAVDEMRRRLRDRAGS